jgi:hypothetical protein
MLWLILDDYLNEFVRVFGACAFGFALAARLAGYPGMLRVYLWPVFMFAFWVALFLSLRLVWVRWAWRKWRERQCSG